MKIESINVNQSYSMIGSTKSESKQEILRINNE